MTDQRLDRSWKDVITQNPDEALEFFTPSLAAELDRSREIVSCFPEHPAVGGASNKGMRVSDICLRLPLL
ncbi:MAG: hypothetical protein LBR38_07540, partial [Synergistaceae bacterium]|nr:hypothetical protein [Synergistaceae bacterium]